MNNVIKYWDDNLVSAHIGTEINWVHSYIEENNIDKISFIDIGGNVGKFFDELSKKYTIENCIVVEPSKKLYNYMVDKFKNNFQVVIHNCGISNENGLFEFNDDGIDYWSEREFDNSINLGIFRMQNNLGETQFYTMDYFMENYNTIDPKKITFIKIDTENKDLYVLRDLKNYLEKNKIRPLILFENNFHADMSLEEAQNIVNDFCDTCGYETTNLDFAGDKFLTPIKNWEKPKSKNNVPKKRIINKIYELVHDFKIDKKFWSHDTLTGEEHDTKRSKPAPYLKISIEIAKILKMKTVVEIGASRYAVTQKCLNYFDNITDVFISPPCCNDGHSTYFLTRAGFDVYSVDIDENVKTAIEWSFQNLKTEKPNNLHVSIPKDGIEFLKEFENKIDFLYLDGWDKGTPEYAEKHLEAFISAKNKLSDVHLILIDDTDFVTSLGGKDSLLSPYLLELGYVPLINGRQTLFINTVNIDGYIEVFDENEIFNEELDESLTDFPNVILSLTTTPNRLSEVREEWGVKPVIERLLSLSYPNYEIHFNIPYINHKTGEEYVIPDWLSKIEDKKMKIFRVNDYGSITKLVPTLMRVNDPELTIITVDDDLIYMDGFIEYHLKKQKVHPDCALGFAGIGASNGSCHLCTTLKKDTQIKILEGYKTASYKRKFFDFDFFTDFIPKSWSDDVVISAYLGKQKIKKIVMNYNKDDDFQSRVESFPIEKMVPNEKSGCNLYRAENISDGSDYFGNLGFLV